MGLDMYLYREGQTRASDSEEVAYWRKANAVHAWFVRNVQAGVDDCGVYPVPREKLIELNGLCAGLLLNRDSDEAREKLPPQSGFFFGGTDLDDWYWQCLEYTCEQLTPLLGAPRGVNYEYHSSW